MQNRQKNFAADSQLHDNNNNQHDMYQNSALGMNMMLLNDTCHVHKGSRLDYMCVDSTQNFVFKCMYCVTDDNINQLTLIPIEQILSADTKTVFANFPIKDRDLTREIKEIGLSPPTGTLIKQQIDTFFKEFRAKLLDRIDAIQQKMVEKAQSISDFGDVLMKNYNKATSKEQIKSIVADQQMPVDNKSDQLKEICAQIQSKDEENTQNFKQLINSMKMLEKATDFETPKLIQESILNKLESINMFLVDDVAQLQRQLLSADHQDQNSLKKDSDLNAIVNLMKLVKNQFNDVSADSCASLEKQLNKYNFVLSQLDVPVPGPLYESFHSFDQEKQKIISGLISELANKEQELLVENVQQGEIEGNNRENHETEKYLANLISEFVGNRTNFCCAEFIEDFSKVMKTIEGLLGLFKVRKPCDKSISRQAFNKLSEKQLENFAKLATQVNMLTHNYSDRYEQSKQPESQIQPNSTLLRDYIENKFYFKIGSAEKREQRIMALNELLVQFPIFELLPLLSFDRQPINMVPTKLAHSSEIKVTVNGSCSEITFPNCAGKRGQVVSETLKNESGYLLRLKFNRPYGKHGNQGIFRIGLIPNSMIDEYYAPYPCTGFTSTSNSYSAKIVTRGGLFFEEPLCSVTSELEIRWCISQRLFFISDTSYTNVNQAAEKDFTPTEIYRLGVCFFKIPESDWKITITDFFEIDQALVSKFE